MASMDCDDSSKSSPKRGRTVDDGSSSAAPEEDVAKKKKRCRPDRAVKLKARRGRTETVVKACLWKHLEDGAHRAAMRDAIQRRVHAFSVRIHAAGLALNRLLIGLFDGAQDLDSVDLPTDIFDATFVRHLMLGTAGTSAAAPWVQHLHAQHPEYLALNGTARYRGDSNVYSAGAIKYITNLKNHLRLNLERFIGRMVKSYGWSNGEASSTMRRITGRQPRKNPENAYVFPERREVVELIGQVRALLGLVDEGAEIDRTWLKQDDNLIRILHCFVLISRRLNQVAVDPPQPAGRPGKKIQRFNLAPVPSIRQHFISIDTNVLYGLMREVGAVDCTEKVFKTLKDDHWQSAFRVGRLLGADRTFTALVETDGTALCVHQTRPKNDLDAINQSASNENTARINYTHDPGTDLVVGGDPGGRTVLHVAVPRLQAVDAAADAHDTSNYESRMLTRGRYYAESGINRANAKAHTWNGHIKGALEAMSGVTSKVCDLAAFQTFMTRYLQHEDVLWREYLKPHWAQQRMRLYGGKKRVFARFFNELLEVGRRRGKRVVMAYGSARFAPGAPGRPAVPTTRAFKECSRRMITIPVDEYRTTCTSCQHGQHMRSVLLKRGGRKVTGLLWCGSTSNEHGKLINRDLNAAINIRRCLAEARRPQHLDRGMEYPRFKWLMGRRLRR